MRFRTARIATKRATHTLEQLHAELAGKLLENKREGKRLTAAMQHVEAVLKLLQPDYSLTRIVVRRRKENPWFKRGTLLRHVLEVLRTTGEPLTPREITTRMLKARNISNATPAQISRVTSSVLSALQSHKGNSIVAHAQTHPIRWSVRT
jgi:hypothetical protein